MSTLKLGHYDQGTAPESWRVYLARYHENGMRTDAFRGDETGVWDTPKSLPGTSVADLQRDLESLGYLPQGPIDGIFGYRTLAAVRLFQEYTRTIRGRPELGPPDGIVGPKTRAALADVRTAAARCRWTVAGRRQDGRWLAMLERARTAYAQDYRRILPELFNLDSDTLAPAAWQTGQAPVHLIGIRRTAWAASLDAAGKRLNNDVYVAIAHGRVMRFFGSTDPNPPMSENPQGMPFLCKGQHAYRFGFHKLSQGAAKSYRALRPAAAGVRVVRDSDGDKTLSPGDTLDAAPNATINIHWSGRGTSNWSAGCQVIGGALHLNDAETTIDCWEHAAIGYATLQGEIGRGAYDVLLSWITVCAPDITRGGRLPYTLIEEQDLKKFAPDLHASALAGFATAARTVAMHDASVRRLIDERAPHLLA